MSKDVSLYLHIPFCASRCGYCNFYSTTRLELRQAYVSALCRAIKTAPLEGFTAATVYFGGGTPSLLGTGLLEVLATLKSRLPFAPDAEITLEANPDSADLETLTALYRGGMNRLSLGLQAADDTSLRRLGRRHTALAGRQAVENARAAGFRNVSGDIMLGTPGQTPADVAALCQMATELKLPHISAYLLKIEPDTAFGRGGVERDCPDADGMADLYLEACALLEKAGYRHYEISNFALPGCESRHNSAYWQLKNYLGIGPAAHSMMEGKRFYFPPDLDGFLEAPNVWETTRQDGEGGGWEEYRMLSLRLAHGLSLTVAAEKYGVDAQKLLQKAAPLLAGGLAERRGDALCLTDRGFLVENSIITFLTD